MNIDILATTHHIASAFRRRRNRSCYRVGMTPGFRLSALALVAALVVSPVVLCAGWSATPEARMACCNADESCPMNDADADAHAGSHPVHPPPAASQSAADACCAASERQSTTSPMAAALGVPLADVHHPVSSVIPALPTPPAAPEMRAAGLAPTIPKHLLLGVFLL
jgi:hypothetical protein